MSPFIAEYRVRASVLREVRFSLISKRFADGDKRRVVQVSLSDFQYSDHAQHVIDNRCRLRTYSTPSEVQARRWSRCLYRNSARRCALRMAQLMLFGDGDGGRIYVLSVLNARGVDD